MKLRVLGSTAAYPRPRGACSGYLLYEGRTRVLLDAGTGAMANLIACLDPWDLSGIFVSHTHVDHYVDLYPLYLFFRFATHQRELPKRVYGPAGLADLLYGLDGGRERIDDVYEFVDHEDGAERLVDGLSVKMTSVPHLGKESFAMRFSGSADLAYSSDCEKNDRLVELARGADALLIEASAGSEGKIMAGHMDAASAAGIAVEAAVGSVILTHLWPTYSWDRAVAEARRIFPGDVHAALEDSEFTLGEKEKS